MFLLPPCDRSSITGTKMAVVNDDGSFSFKRPSPELFIEKISNGEHPFYLKKITWQPKSWATWLCDLNLALQEVLFSAGKALTERTVKEKVSLSTRVKIKELATEECLLTQAQNNDVLASIILSIKCHAEGQDAEATLYLQRAKSLQSKGSRKRIQWQKDILALIEQKLPLPRPLLTVCAKQH